jgi:hypothetical protein
LTCFTLFRRFGTFQKNGALADDLKKRFHKDTITEVGKRWQSKAPHQRSTVFSFCGQARASHLSAPSPPHTHAEPYEEVAEYNRAAKKAKAPPQSPDRFPFIIPFVIADFPFWPDDDQDEGKHDDDKKE